MSDTIERCNQRCATGCTLRVLLPMFDQGPGGTCTTTITTHCLSGVQCCQRCDSEFLIFPGNANAIYNISVRVRGVVERQDYTGGTSPGNNAFYIGGKPNVNGFNFFGASVSEPYQRYFFNRGNGFITGSGFNCSCLAGGSNRICILDYTVIIPIRGGARITLFADSEDRFELISSGCSVPGITNPPQPYCGQFLQLDFNCSDFLPLP